MNLRPFALISCLAAATEVSSEVLFLDGEQIYLDQTQSVAFELDSNDIHVQTDHGSMICGVGPDSPPVVQLTGQPLLIQPGDPVTLTWSTQDADTCQPTLGNTQWLGTTITLPGGNTVINNVTQSTTFGLECSNSFGTTSDSVFIEVDGSSGGGNPVFPGVGVLPPGCSATPIPGVSWQHEPALFEDVFNRPFPGTMGIWENINVNSFEHVSLWFNSGEAGPSSMEVVESAGQGGHRLRSFWMSACPGGPPVDGPDCVWDWGHNGKLFTEVDAAQLTTKCDLEPNSGYYMNVISARYNTNPSNTDCRSGGGSVLEWCQIQMIPRP